MEICQITAKAAVSNINGVMSKTADFNLKNNMQYNRSVRDRHSPNRPIFNLPYLQHYFVCFYLHPQSSFGTDGSS